MSFNKKGSSQCLLPGIPNEITLDLITPKLSWRDFYVLSSVSRAWLLVIRSRQVYNIRVRQQCTETLVLINYIHHTSGNSNTLYSIKDNWSCELPHIANVAGGFLEGSQSVSLDGNIYVLGGQSSSDFHGGTRSVYVLDLVGQRQWRRCADMIQPRTRFACGVMHGKIYVFGGNERSAAECYDPKGDKWSAIFSSTLPRFYHHVEVVGEEFFLNGGDYVNGGIIFADDIDVYNPAKDEWRVIQPVEQDVDKPYFGAKGQLHVMDEVRIRVHNPADNSWTHLHWWTLSSPQAALVEPYAVLEVKDELLAVVHCSSAYEDGNEIPAFNFLARTKGLGNKTVNPVRWRKALELPLSRQKDQRIRGCYGAVFMHAIEF